LKELLVPGATVVLQDHGADTPRKLRYTLQLVRSVEGFWVSLNTQLPNRMVTSWLQAGVLPGCETLRLQRREIVVGESRFDFLLQGTQGLSCLLEVKSVTLVASGQAWFPDAPTVRGARHVRELATLTQAGAYQGRVLFVVQREDATCVSPNRSTDPDFSDALALAHRAGVELLAVRVAMSPQGYRFAGPIPVLLA
jgi:sugar fermentation stimulation protein A